MERIEAVKSRYGVDQTTLATVAGMSASSYKRYKRRIRCGDVPVKRPGVKKVAPIDLQELEQQIKDLDHGKRRSAGTGRLYQANSHGISRREFNAMVRQARSAYNRESTSALCRVRWLCPDIAWALDGMQYNGCYVQNLQDLCSHYKFAPLTTAHMPCGEEIAGHLERHLTGSARRCFLKGIMPAI